MATYLTPKSLEKLQNELKELTNQKRGLSKDIEIARAHGDLKENAEYHAAKERLGQVMAKLGMLQMKLSNVQLYDASKLKADVVTLGMEVTVKDLSDDSKEKYTLVGPDESDPMNGLISVASPMGKAFLGAKVKEKVTAQLPGGAFKYQILSIKPSTA